VDVAARFADREDGRVPRVALLLHPTRRESGELAQVARTWWDRHGYDVVDLADADARAGAAAGGLELAISLGGDGTMLRTVELASPLGAPVLGVNLGRMGYLTEVEPAGLETAFKRFVGGDYTVAERMMLAVSVETAGGRPVAATSKLVALNEAVLEKVAPGHTIRFDLVIGGRPFLSYAADGLIVSTPTGSTAYNLSVRGPIVSPSLRAVVVTPISPHMLFDRSLVVEPDVEVSLRLTQGPTAALVLDGSPALELRAGDTVTCRASEEPARIVTFGARDFHAILRAKFGLTDR
jgi:NAD+ kinase